LDIGDRRVGIALSDPLGNARPLLTLGRTHLRKELRDLGRIIRKHSVTAIVAGNPLFASGDVSPQAKKVHAYAQAVADEFQLPVHLQDERLSSAAAEELLDRMGHPRGPERKAVLDQWSAVVILQDWLDARPAASTETGGDPGGPAAV
jgi:putative Holliday junction resolvase